jgi:hypothetical protein
MAAPNNYIRIDNNIGHNAKMLEVDESLYLEAIGLYMLVLCHCDRSNTDGRLTRRAVTGMRGVAPGRDDIVDELLRVGLLVDGSHLTVPDYLEWQRSKEDKEARSRQASKAAAIMQANRSAKRSADSSADSSAFGMQKRREERYKGLRRKNACSKCEGQGWVWITDDRAGTCPDCEGRGTT